MTFRDAAEVFSDRSDETLFDINTQNIQELREHFFLSADNELTVGAGTTGDFNFFGDVTDKLFIAVF